MRLPLAALLLLTAVGCGGAEVRRWSPEPDATAEQAVVFISTECSGTLVGESIVVTAAHCMEDSGPWSVQIAGRDIEVADCAIHPEAYVEPRACGAGRGRTDDGHDLAVLALAEPVRGVDPVPVLLTEPTFGRRWWRSMEVRLVGWDRRPRLVGPLARRSGTNRIVWLHGARFETAPEDRQGFRTIIGDSGGPALVRIAGRESVLGILQGGPAERMQDSVYCSTFHPDNARWLLSVLPSDWGRDLPHVEREASDFDL